MGCINMKNCVYSRKLKVLPCVDLGGSHEGFLEGQENRRDDPETRGDMKSKRNTPFKKSYRPKKNKSAAAPVAADTEHFQTFTYNLDGRGGPACGEAVLANAPLPPPPPIAGPPRS